jgi:hypothetical protein
MVMGSKSLGSLAFCGCVSAGSAWAITFGGRGMYPGAYGAGVLGNGANASGRVLDCDTETLLDADLGLGSSLTGLSLFGILFASLLSRLAEMQETLVEMPAYVVETRENER